MSETESTPPFTDEQLAIEGFDTFDEKSVAVLAHKIGFNVLFMAKPITTFEDFEFRADARRFGTMESLSEYFINLKVEGVLTIGLHKVARSPSDKLTVIRMAFKVGV